MCKFYNHHNTRLNACDCNYSKAVELSKFKPFTRLGTLYMLKKQNVYDHVNTNFLH